MTTKSGVSNKKNCFFFAGHQWLMLVILATWEAEIGRIAV
jgi:hypothetical protein